MNLEELVSLRLFHQRNAALQVTQTTLSPIPYPYKDAETGEIKLADVMIWGVSGGAGFHSVIVSSTLSPSGDNDYSIWCGDAYLEGKAKYHQDRIDAISGSLSSDRYRSALSGGFGMLEENGKCHFWPNWKKNKKLCKHTAAVVLDYDMKRTADLLDCALREFTKKMNNGLPDSLSWIFGFPAAAIATD